MEFLPVKQVSLKPDPRSLVHLGLGPSELGGVVRQVLDEHTDAGAWAESGISTSTYLDLMEIIVRTASSWQDPSGAIIDPVEGREFAQTSPRYAAPGAILLRFGRIPDLRESVCATMDYACRRLARKEAESPDFWMRELTVAYMCLAELVSSDRLDGWKRDLRSIEPESTYWRVRQDGHGLDQLHNWTVYAAAGEFVRHRLGLGPGQPDTIWGEAFFEKYMPAQLRHFTRHGMYRDPHEPMTYDITTRLQIAVALSWGYEGGLAADLSELLRRGGLSMLLFVSPGGYAPFGGRSGQLNFQEAILTALCEVEARRYREVEPILAGAFKRQAHLSAASVKRWIADREPFQFVKNGFNPTDSFGLDGYAKYSCYGLLAASFFGLAALLADDGISERPCPVEIGGYAFELNEGFHKVFATCSGTHVEIETRADLHYDSTGLGRFHRRGVPVELGLSMPFTGTPRYSMPATYLSNGNVAIGPCWQEHDRWVCLADLCNNLASRFRQEYCESRDCVAFAVEYASNSRNVAVTEEYRLSEGRLDIRSRIDDASAAVGPIRFQIPLLVTDGETRSSIRKDKGRVDVTYRDAMMTVCFDESLDYWIDTKLRGNPNGLYELLVIQSEDNSVRVTLSLRSSHS